MTKKLAEKLRERNLKMAPVDQETSEIIKRISKITNEQPSQIMKEAVSMLAQALGRKVILREKDSNWDLVIEGYSNQKKLYNGKTN
ncbi:hypothetical protein KC678_02345 [Candidatus Dojkabacteria bacterium]|uniref:Uncharacterized protein n=1 Tax=Candidatus Dojkabacteria bacterium TaxID=2099670 RepID=A0A955L182_9BACT|nr:hypothetical protein [Candidatus Dojkabacteria bacterium]